MSRRSTFCSVILFVCMCVLIANAQKCKVPATAPERIEKVINQCQEEIKIAILTEALQSLKIEAAPPARRVKRDVFSQEERRIAGCLLQCVYRKMKAVDEYGFPTVEGLLRIYSDGVTDQGYYLATLQAVQQCLGTAQKKHIQKLTNGTARTTLTVVLTGMKVGLEFNVGPKLVLLDPVIPTKSGKTCDIAYDTFECVSDTIGEYCGQKP